MKILERKISVKSKQCYDCKSTLKVTYELTELEQYGIKNNVSYYAPLLNCAKCNTAYLAPENDEIQHEATCYAFGVLNAREIKDIRLSIPWGSNNRDFSLILEFGSATVSRYESFKSIPSKTHNNILLGIKGDEFRKNVIEKGDGYKEYLKRQKKRQYSSNIVNFPKTQSFRKKLFPELSKNNLIEINLSNAEAFKSSTFESEKVMVQ